MIVEEILMQPENMENDALMGSVNEVLPRTDLFDLAPNDPIL